MSFETVARDCPICMDEIDETVNCVITECGHYFHTKCLIQACYMYWEKDDNCLCPICRRNIQYQMKYVSSFEDKLNPYNLTLEEFILYINNNLSIIPEEDPYITLISLLNKYNETDYLPINVHSPQINLETNKEIPFMMEFQKEYIATRLVDRKPLYIYVFTGFVNKKKFFKDNKKYFEYIIDDDGITLLNIC